MHPVVHWNSTLFIQFPDGLDWVLKQEDAYACLDEWREEVIGGRASGTIREAITKNESMAFGLAAILRTISSMPQSYIHSSLLPVSWHSPSLKAKCCVEVNSENPFAFNESLEQNYHSGYVTVHQKKSVRMPLELYNSYVSLDLFDPKHVIGAPYKADPASLVYCSAHIQQGYKFVTVHQFEDMSRSTQAFSVIVAQALPGNGWTVSFVDWTDIRTRGNSTTLGPASFQESMQNKPSASASQRGCGCPPKPAKSGKVGRLRTATSQACLQIPKMLLAGTFTKRARDDSPGPIEPSALSLSPIKRCAERKKAKV
ncbi:hypothetical protein DFP72DRAFT_1071979 [Ephemerocybe angulata]|uniref:Uncharacterized protein n=1 Tax=Ephemerocybe angulata TaxID=980116 RepID=A0A8H6M1E2_9AGAR|nr:hypothetical protein DFP72DRAFT_1071979 [Tulosesus angulatus]